MRSGSYGIPFTGSGVGVLRRLGLFINAAHETRLRFSAD
jgi:hypothetical protein